MKIIGLLLIVLSTIILIPLIIGSIVSLSEEFDFSSVSYDIRRAKRELKTMEPLATDEELQEQMLNIKTLKKKASKILFGWFLIIGVLLTIHASCVIPGSLCLKYHYDSSYEKQICEIVSLERDSETLGKFFLGSGTVKEEQYYYFYKITNKGYKLDSTKCEVTYIIEDDTKTPSLCEVKEQYTWNEYYVLNVPTGTIIKEFKA